MNKNQRVALAVKDLTVRRLGEILDRHPVYISNVLGGRYPSPDLREKIADILGEPVSHLWPEPHSTNHYCS